MATEKQKLAAQHLLANPGSSKAEAMRAAGYSENTIKNPKDLTTSEGWKELVSELSREIDLTETLKEGIYADKPIGNGEVFPDYPTRLKYAEAIAKIGGGFAPNKVEVTVPTPILGAITDEE